MKIISSIILVFSVVFAQGQSIPKTSDKNYELIAEDSGILIERFDSTVVDENKYNHNNIIYKVGSSFNYKFEHITAKGIINYFQILDDGSTWEFVEATKADSTTIKSVLIEVANGNPMAERIPDYNQTPLVYRTAYLSSHSMSGAIENEGNVWIHPPRDYYFEILELNPFPYIKAPYEIGTRWTWNLKIGDHWSDARWKLWEGAIENEYDYEITKRISLETAVGLVDCWVIESKASSRLGETSLTAYFNATYGFVKLDYTNIDGSKTILELVEYQEN